MAVTRAAKHLSCPLPSAAPCALCPPLAPSPARAHSRPLAAQSTAQHDAHQSPRAGRRPPPGSRPRQPRASGQAAGGRAEPAAAPCPPAEESSAPRLQSGGTCLSPAGDPCPNPFSGRRCFAGVARAGSASLLAAGAEAQAPPVASSAAVGGAASRALSPRSRRRTLARTEVNCLHSCRSRL